MKVEDNLVDTTPLNIGADRQLFVDDFWVAEARGAKRILHKPTPREVVIEGDRPWDRGSISCVSFMLDDGRYRAWYRADHDPGMVLKRSGHDTAYAESRDGLYWEKPELGLFEIDGSKQNNLLWMGPGRNLVPFIDLNPDARPDQRYKALGTDKNLYAFASTDGIHWNMMQDEPVMADGPFDTIPVAFWDVQREEYVAYTRGVADADPDVDPVSLKGVIGHEFKGGVRWIRRSTSKDFVNWTPLELIDTGDTPFEHLYTNACVQYERAPGYYLIFSMRYLVHRSPDPDWTYSPGVCDVVFMSSRDGINFDRSFMEAFVTPGLDQNNWHDRGVSLHHGILQLTPEEMSMYGNENTHLPTQRTRRYTLRTDGFVSVNAGYDGGEFTTRPMIFSGDELELNYSTSAVGSVRIEVQDMDGNTLTGFGLDECPEKFGDEIEGTVSWSGGDIGSLKGKPVKLRFVLMDADVYAFRFK
jgi:hypothetical protein